MTCLFSNKPHLEVECEPTLLVPGESSEVVIEFRPRETVKYSELVLFEINGLFRKGVTVKGEGAPMKVHCTCRVYLKPILVVYIYVIEMCVKSSDVRRVETATTKNTCIFSLYA